MSLDVIGAGFGRTGTLSLKLALEELGFVKCHHMTEVFQNPDQAPKFLAAARGETVDWDQPLARQVNPEAGDIWYDGVDQNCDGADDFDKDEDK